MKKEELLQQFEEDFKKTQGALSEIIEHNRSIDNVLVEDLLQEDFKRLEEHIEISKLIMDGVKGFNELYKNTSSILDSINKLPDSDKKESKSSLESIMKDLD